MIKAILLDCGGVLVKPASGDWMLGPDYETVLGEKFAQTHLSAFRRARAAFLHLLPDANCVDDEDTEMRMFIEYFRASLGAIGVTPGTEALARLAWLQVYRSDRYILFDDVLPALRRWHGRYRLGIVSDAPPSTRRIMREFGVMDFIDAATFSCDIGVLKPGAAIYQRTLSLLDVQASEAMFIDDMPGKLRGGQMVGIRGVQMRRKMPPLFDASPRWDGPAVHSMAALDRLLNTISEASHA